MALLVVALVFLGGAALGSAVFSRKQELEMDPYLEILGDIYDREEA